MENVLELLRDGEHGLSRTALDVLFSCLDTLDTMTGEIESGGAETSRPDVLVAKLRSLVGEEAAAAPATSAPLAAAPASVPSAAPASASSAAPEAAAIGACEARGLAVRRLELGPAEDCDMPSVRLFLACRALEERGELIGAEPPLDAVERGEIGDGSILLWLATSDEEPALRAALEQVEGVRCLGLHTVDGEAAASAASPPGTPAPAARGARTRPAPSSAQPRRQTVRVDAERLDLLMHLMGEMVVQRTRLEGIAQSAGLPELHAAVGDLSRVAQSLQAMVMQVRMVPIETVFMRFPRMVRDLAAKLGKQVELTIHGEDTELDRTVVEALGDPLVHLVRNALDHGFEPPDERAALGKPASASLEIAAAHAGGDVHITVRDDGRGVHPQRVGEIAVRRGRRLAP
jgi:two-component system chemotaxis sensor kinase CheA